MIALYTLCAINFAAVAFVAWRVAPLFKMAADKRFRSKHVEKVVGFGPTVVEANKTAVFEATLAFDFTGERLIVPDALARDFAVVDIQANGKSQRKESGGPIPAAAFSEQAIGVRLDMDRVKKGGTVRLHISNVTDKPTIFSGVLIGLTPRDRAETMKGAGLNGEGPSGMRAPVVAMVPNETSPQPGAH